MERDVLEILLKGKEPIVVSPARGVRGDEDTEGMASGHRARPVITGINIRSAFRARDERDRTEAQSAGCWSSKGARVCPL